MSTVEELQEIAEFDHVFEVTRHGIIDAPGIYAPEVYHSETNDIDIYGDEWEALKGYTGQYSYNGAVMHSSEFIGGRLAQDILDTPGVYVVVVVAVEDDPDNPAGWAILRHKDAI